MGTGEISRTFIQENRGFQRINHLVSVNNKDEVIFLRKVLEFATVFLTGGAAYSLLEILWRGYTHWTMTITGGICFTVLYILHVYARTISFLTRCVIGTAVITLVEFAVGCTVNLWLGWHVWDYANVPGNVLGQICLPFSLMWLLLCAAACPICRRLADCFSPLAIRP